MKVCPLKVAGSFAYSGDDYLVENASDCDGIECEWWVEMQPAENSGCAPKIIAMGFAGAQQNEGNKKTVV